MFAGYKIILQLAHILKPKTTIYLIIWQIQEITKEYLTS